ncbi:MAG: glycosyltransferase family 2 protein [Spirochaetales bacterium]|nr:glycosyltransferase family 2 protein [Spirochaetales bacterium]
MWNTIVFSIFILFFIFIIILTLIDYRKKRVLKSKPYISVIVPTYNDENTLKNTIKSIFRSYDNSRLELIVINDNSSDGTTEILKGLKKTYNFRLINNKVNMGKVKSINNAFPYTKGEIIFVIDSDTVLNRKAVLDMLSRLEYDSVGATSCRYKPINSGFLARMQEIEYGMISILQTAYNSKSTLSLWGGCMAFKRDAFEDVQMLSENALIEDMDLALKLGKSGWKVEEASSFVFSTVPTNLKTWFRQKIRWGAGGMQNVIKHFSFFIFHPIFLIFTITYTFLTISFVIAMAHNILFFENMLKLFHYFRQIGFSIATSFGLMKVSEGFNLFKEIMIYFLYPLFSIPYVIINMSGKREWYKILLVIPFSLIYFPVFISVGFMSYIYGIYKFFVLRNSERAW